MRVPNLFQTCTKCSKTKAAENFERRPSGKRRRICNSCFAAKPRRTRHAAHLRMGPETLGSRWRLRKTGHDHIVHTHPLPSYGEVVTMTVRPQFAGKTLDELRDQGYMVEAA